MNIYKHHLQTFQEITYHRILLPLESLAALLKLKKKKESNKNKANPIIEAKCFTMHQR